MYRNRGSGVKQWQMLVLGVELAANLASARLRTLCLPSYLTSGGKEVRVCVALVIGLVSASAVAALVSSHEASNPQEAYTYTAEIAGYGERWPGSPGHEKILRRSC
jgi:hypothetical protein